MKRVMKIYNNLDKRIKRSLKSRRKRNWLGMLRAR
jgi:hypothetical protein